MYRALKSFVGKVSMTKGDIKEKIDKNIAKDLIKAGYIIEEKNQKKVETKKETKQKSSKEDK